MGDMGNVKVAYRAGDKASKPTSGATHPEQKPGNADKNPCSKMSWTGSKAGYKK